MLNSAPGLPLTLATVLPPSFTLTPTVHILLSVTVAFTVSLSTPPSTSGTILRLSMECDRHRFQPHGLPDAGGRRVHDAAGVERLLAARLALVVGRIEHPHDEFLRAAAAQ